MTAAQKRKFLEAVDEIERDERNLTPEAIVSLFLTQYPDLWAELKEPLAEEFACQLQMEARTQQGDYTGSAAKSAKSKRAKS